MSESPRSWFDETFARRLERLRLVARRRARSATPGARRGERRGRSVEVRGHRAYAVGDDFRDVDWSAFLRLERLYVREREDEAAREVLFVIDRSASMRGAKLELAKRLVAALAYVALCEEDQVAVASFAAGEARRAPPVRGVARIVDVVRFLDAQRAEGATSIEAACRRAARGSRRPGLAVLVTDFLDDASAGAALRALADGRRELVLAHVVSNEDAAPTIGGDLELEDAETGERVRLHVDRRARDEYRAAFGDFSRALELETRALGGSYALVRASAPLEDAVLSVLKTSGAIA